MLKKELARTSRHKGIRKKITGTTARPRLCVRRSLNQMYAQAIDDIAAKTLCSASTADKDLKSAKGSKTTRAEQLGTLLASRLKAQGISKIAFDRAGYQYHGRVKALADSLRKAGIEF